MNRTFTLLLIFLATSCYAQFGNSGGGIEWTAQWITLPNSDNEKSALYHFRKSINMESIPESYKVHISADNRYKLYVNGQLVSVGPYWGDIENWNYETVELAPYLKPGKNVLSAEVWNEAELRPVAQFSYKTALILQHADSLYKGVNTNSGWKVREDLSYTAKPQQVRGYYAAGAGDAIDFNKKIQGWKRVDFDDSSWESATPVFATEVSGFGFRQRPGWKLVPTILPSLELREERFANVRKSEGVRVPPGFPTSATPVRIPANSSAKILLDQGHLTNAYPTLRFSGGDGAQILITYAEGLYDAEGAKGNRDVIEGKTISGRRDSLISGGMANQEFTTLTYRTFRYVELDIKTRAEPLVIEDIYGTFTGYPFEMKATLRTDRSELKDIMEIGWRTARLCAVDTYMDCPYYERLQYVGDTRIQHFVSYYNSGDERLAKNALNLIDYSRQPDGYTLSRYPDRQNQVIPTYSLWYVSMLYDYLMYGSDKEFVADKLMGTRQILNYFITYLDSDGSLKNVPGWNYTDWVPEWRFGMAPMAEDGSSAALDLQMLHALQAGISLEQEAGNKEFVALYSEFAKQLAVTIREKYWDASGGLFADTPAKDTFSQHVNSLAILAGLVDAPQMQAIGEALLNDDSLAPASIYFKYYLHLALKEAGYGDKYLDMLDIWRKNMELGLTTWGETSQVETTRSDCHAWGSSPNIEFFRILLGIESAAPNFKQVRIAPNLGDIDEIGGEMPHPEGSISVDYKRSGQALEATVTLPAGLTGEFHWNGKVRALQSGRNNFSI
ncbi:family 78 glycoside hydrolase catalytic domain [Robiginitalea biformata]|nr:family 78 glycoside hydrolase catalytic domain [Robiginitalea biformata]